MKYKMIPVIKSSEITKDLQLQYGYQADFSFGIYMYPMKYMQLKFDKKHIEKNWDDIESGKVADAVMFRAIYSILEDQFAENDINEVIVRRDDNEISAVSR